MDDPSKAADVVAASAELLRAAAMDATDLLEAARRTGREATYLHERALCGRSMLGKCDAFLCPLLASLGFCSSAGRLVTRTVCRENDIHIYGMPYRIATLIRD